MFDVDDQATITFFFSWFDLNLLRMKKKMTTKFTDFVFLLILSYHWLRLRNERKKTNDIFISSYFFSLSLLLLLVPSKWNIFSLLRKREPFFQFQFSLIKISVGVICFVYEKKKQIFCFALVQSNLGGLNENLRAENVGLETNNNNNTRKTKQNV